MLGNIITYVFEAVIVIFVVVFALRMVIDLIRDMFFDD